MKLKNVMLALIAALWLTACSCKDAPIVTGVDGCLMFSEIPFTAQDRELLGSGLSTEALVALRNHQDIYRAKCKPQK